MFLLLYFHVVWTTMSTAQLVAEVHADPFPSYDACEDYLEAHSDYWMATSEKPFCIEAPKDKP